MNRPFPPPQQYFPGELFQQIEPLAFTSLTLTAQSPCEVSIAISLKRIADAFERWAPARRDPLPPKPKRSREGLRFQLGGGGERGERNSYVDDVTGDWFDESEVE